VSPWLLVAIAGLVLAPAGVLLTRRYLIVVTVVGMSMQPTYRPGDRVLVRRIGRRIVPGTVVVLAEPPPAGWAGSPPVRGVRTRRTATGWIIKRVVALPGDSVPEAVRPAVDGTVVVPPDSLVVLGDHSRSADSRRWGFAPTDQVLGTVIRRLPINAAP
jgi:signal peptidase I